MPTPRNSLGGVDPLPHYRDVGATILTHLRGHRVLGFGDLAAAPRPTDHVAHLHIADLADLDEAVRSGVVHLWLPDLVGAELVTIRIRPGADAGIDIVATAALALTEQLAHDGRAVCALTDGAGGLYLIGYGVGPANPHGGAVGYAGDLSARAPEIATVDECDADGRALLIPFTSAEAIGVPAPYSLVPADGELGAITPLTLDELAAASAGMPLDFDPSDLAARIIAYGDLAAGLAEANNPPA